MRNYIRFLTAALLFFVVITSSPAPYGADPAFIGLPDITSNGALDDTSFSTLDDSGLIISGTVLPDHPLGTGRETIVEWWNINYDFRRKVVIVEPDIDDRVMEPVHITMPFTGDVAREGIVAVAYWDTSSWTEVPSQVWNATTHNTGGTDYYDSCTVCFFVNITQNYQEVFYIYYDDTYATPPTYTDHINALPANGPVNDDTTMPWVYSEVTSTNYTNVDMVYIRSSATTNEHAAILLTDEIRG
ncbi:MAG: hypothetical protein ACFFCO_01265, partial [Promethearchaeota archaeon]